MKTVSFFHNETGLFHGATISASDESAIALNTPAGHTAIEGVFDAKCQAVDLTQSPHAVIDYQPPSPGDNYEWNTTTKRWRLNAETQARNDARTSAMFQIQALEASQHRAVREAALGVTGAAARLQTIDSQIAALRADL